VCVSSAGQTFTHTQPDAISPTHTWDSECAPHFESGRRSRPTSCEPGGTLDSGPVHARDFSSFLFLPCSLHHPVPHGVCWSNQSRTLRHMTFRDSVVHSGFCSRTHRRGRGLNPQRKTDRLTTDPMLDNLTGCCVM